MSRRENFDLEGHPFVELCDLLKLTALVPSGGIAKQAIAALDGFSIPFSAPNFNEFVVEATEPVDALMKLDLAAGVDVQIKLN